MCKLARCKVRGGKDEAALVVRSQSVVRDRDHLDYQTTEVVLGLRAATNQTATHLSAPTCTSVHGQDVMAGQEMIVVQEPVDREGWSGCLEGDDTSFLPFQGSATATPIPNKHGRVPGAVPPNRAGAGIYLQEKWMVEATSRSSSSHCELSLRLQQQKAAPGQVLGSCDKPPNRSGSLTSRSDLITLGRAILASSRVLEKSSIPMPLA